MDDDNLSKRRVGRPPKYDWSDKKELCYKLYVEEKKSGAEIAQYFAERLNVAPEDLPCRRSFLRQFALWGFMPHKRKLTAEDQEAAAARIRELWEANVNQIDIRATLEEEGWQLSRHDFYKLWRKDGLALRSDRGFKTLNSDGGPKKTRKRRAPVDPAQQSDPFMAELEAAAALHEPETTSGNNVDGNELMPPLDPEQEFLRIQRLNDLQRESDERLQTGKRRRRIRGYGPLPPDAQEAEPRYSSETTLDECKAFLHLTNEHYVTVRKDYQTICEEMGIMKKTECADGVWEESKRRLIRENMHLSAMLHPLQPEQEKKANALDCLCMDVTKRMRVADKAITIAEANNILGINPSESKAIRRSLYEIFTNDNFESRLVCGEEHWNNLKQSWINGNEKLREALAEGVPKKSRCIDLLCRDSMKRYQGDKTKHGARLIPTRVNVNHGPGPGPAWAAPAPRSKSIINAKAAKNGETPVRMPQVLPQPQHQPPPLGQSRAHFAPLDATNSLNNHAEFNFDLDPALNASFVQPPAVPTIGAYFRLAQGSHIIGHHPKMWLGKIAPTMQSLIANATSKAGAATVSNISGIVKNVEGHEDSWVIENDDELEVYLSEAGDKPSFLVVLVGGYA